MSHVKGEIGMTNFIWPVGLNYALVKPLRGISKHGVYSHYNIHFLRERPWKRILQPMKLTLMQNISIESLQIFYKDIGI